MMKTIRILLLIAAACSGLNFACAQTWTQTSAPNKNWNCVASSADGAKLIVVGTVYPNETCISTNSGLAWISNSPYLFGVVASSADGTKLVAVTGTGNVSPIYVSADSGNTWIQTTAPTNIEWYCLASSADGTKIIAAGSPYNPGPIYASTNSGSTWMATSAPLTNWVSIACSADGNKLAAVIAGGGIYHSTDFGVTWTLANAPNTNWLGVASSVDGIKLVATAGSGGIYASTDAGTNWTLTSAPKIGWYPVASSADGTKLAAGSLGGSIYTSTNSGITWEQNSTPNADWISIASSADGNRLIAIFYSGGGVYAFQTMPSPQINITPTYSGFKFSWIIPSTNFVMQQSSDLASWSSVTNTPVLNLTNLQNELTLFPTNSSGFYRLTTP